MSNRRIASRSWLRILVSVSAALLLIGGSSAYAQEIESADTATYILQEGDTLYELAVKLGTSVELLEKINEMNGGVLRAGGEFLIPANKSSTSYVVRRGDTLMAISRRFGVSVTKIQRANGMSGTGLQAGATVVIPGQGVRLNVSLDELGSESAMEGFAVVYPEIFENRLMTNGNAYDPDRYTISHPNFPLGSIVWVREVASGRESFAEVTDRGFNEQPLLIDVSRALAGHLLLDPSQEARIQIRKVYGVE